MTWWVADSEGRFKSPSEQISQILNQGIPQRGEIARGSKIKEKNDPVGVDLCGSCPTEGSWGAQHLHLTECRVEAERAQPSLLGGLAVSSLQGWVLCLPQRGQESYSALCSEL